MGIDPCSRGLLQNKLNLSMELNQDVYVEFKYITQGLETQTQSKSELFHTREFLLALSAVSEPPGIWFLPIVPCSVSGHP